MSQQYHEIGLFKRGLFKLRNGFHPGLAEISAPDGSQVVLSQPKDNPFIPIIN